MLAEYFAVMDAVIIAFATIAFVLSIFFHKAFLYAVILGIVHCTAAVMFGHVESAVVGGILVLMAMAFPVIVIASWRSGDERNRE